MSDAFVAWALHAWPPPHAAAAPTVITQQHIYIYLLYVHPGPASADVTVTSYAPSESEQMQLLQGWQTDTKVVDQCKVMVLDRSVSAPLLPSNCQLSSAGSSNAADHTLAAATCPV